VHEPLGIEWLKEYRKGTQVLEVLADRLIEYREYREP